MPIKDKSSSANGTKVTRYETLARRWHARYEGSLVNELITGLGDLNFGDRILLLGASLLLTVLPLIIILSAFASYRFQDDIARHLGLSQQGARIIDGFFHASVTSFNLAILVSLLLSFAGTIAVARSIQAIYEQAFKQPHAVGMHGLLRSVIWVIVLSGVVIADSAIGKALRDQPAGPLLMGLIEFAAFTVFFWWSIHFLLGGRESWRHTYPAAIATSLFWIGLGVFASFYFSSTIVSDSKTYGTIGAIFTLVSWFIAMGAVVMLGAVVGAVWQRRWSEARNEGENRPQ